MGHLPILIQDLGLILIAAAVMTLLFKQLRQPIVLGYLIAGFLVGPHFTWLPVVQEWESIEVWSEIGVIFMLFGLGLEFSFKKLVNVGKTASITATFEIFAMILIGFIVGRMFGWSMMTSLFLGAILSMSSTTIIVKAFGEQDLKGRSFAPIVFGVLIVEDLIAILLLVLLGSIAVTQRFSGSELLSSSLQLIFFLILWFVLGIYLLPAFLRFCRKLLTDEILLIVSIALCLMMVIIAVQVGFSAALGAFVMGSLLAETSKGTKIEHLTLPVKDLFSAIFFVSVGMLIDPTVLWEYFGTILIIVAITIFGKFLGTAIGALISGCSIKNSMQAGMSMAQIGEFSFIIATLGKTLHVTDD
ncbi:MAG: cation:proton antiporter, partial [Planctomycetaceae bacterium]|nr:cation:proton antiporter [Planctomycetaceae bacterium]